MLIDTHCHLTDEKLIDQVEGVIARAKEAGVTRMIVPTTGILDGKKAIEIAEKYQGVWAMVGVHPEVLESETNPMYRDEWLASGGEWVNRVRELARSSGKVVGIGEIGLDFYYDKEKRSLEIQMRIFQEQLELAMELNLPVAIHMRAAEAEMRQVLDQMEKLPGGQFHCWAGSEDLLNSVLKKGFYVSFCGNITYKSAGDLRELIKKVPIDRLLLETDSPYLSPEGHRSSFNEPANVTILAEYIAKLLGIELETLINQTTRNAQCLFFAG